MAKFTAIVRKKVTSRSPAINTYGRQILLDPSGKELPKGEDNQYIGGGTKKVDVSVTDSVDDPLTDEQGNPVERGTVEALLSAVKEVFLEETDTEVVSVTVQEIRVIQVVSGTEVMK